MPHIGVLALQGAFQKHIDMLRGLRLDARPFRAASEIPELSGLILPGGESTTMGKLMERRALVEPLRSAIAGGLPVFATCAGLILMADEIDGSEQTRLGGLDIRVERNAYGSQVESFEAKIDVDDPASRLKFEIDGLFIRAPRITRVGAGIGVLASFAGVPVLVRRGPILGMSFHPELTECPRLHEYFARELCRA
jgi:pyridoxal 5'-phosphate synthase pdxT subunit